MGGLGERCKACGLTGEFREYVLQHRAGGDAGADEPEPVAGPGGGLAVSCCIFHHLLLGKGHDKEKAMVDAAKGLGLRGAILYGTPGLVLVEFGEESRGSVVEFMNQSRKIGKKGEVRWRPAPRHEAASSKSLVFSSRPRPSPPPASVPGLCALCWLCNATPLPVGVAHAPAGRWCDGFVRGQARAGRACHSTGAQSVAGHAARRDGGGLPHCPRPVSGWERPYWCDV